jgi:hypothetical protein
MKLKRAHTDEWIDGSRRLRAVLRGYRTELVDDGAEDCCW